MGWDQGPYPALDDVVQRVTLADAARTIHEQQIECVYALFQVYDESVWAPAADGVDVGVWTLLRTLLEERARGRIDVPIVFHYGFDVHNLDAAVVRALDGHVFCNEEQVTAWTTPVADGGRGLDLWDGAAVTAVLDGDRPMLEFMGDDFAVPRSTREGAVHTVCIGRPFNIDVRALADRGIHLHVYGNGFDDVSRLLADGVLRSGAARDLRRIREFVHFRTSRQPSALSWAAVQREKIRWVHEFSQYDAGWSYIGTPFGWRPLDDRAAIPNRLATYLLAGLPVVTDRRPGFYRYEELHRLGVDVELVDGDYDALARSLASEVATRTRRDRARAARYAHSFDASIGDLVAVLERARRHYFDCAIGERQAFVDDRQPLLHLTDDVARPPLARWLRRAIRRTRAETVGRVSDLRAHRLARELSSGSGAP
jgi:hypothetical protein